MQIGDGLSVEQGKVSVDAGDGLEIDDAGKINAVYSNPNLLDNPWFTVNQRGVSTFTAGYGVDRWMNNGGASDVFTVTNSGINTVNSKQLLQRIEDSVSSNYNGKMLTASVLLENGEIYYGSSVVDINSTVVFVDNDLLKIQMSKSSGVHAFIIEGKPSITIKAVKLEKGTISTLANDVPPNYAEELLKCQRYQIPIPIASSTAPFMLGSAHTTTSVRGFLPLPTQMRTTPQLEYIKGNVSSFIIANESKTTNPTSVSLILAQNNGLLFMFTVSNVTTSALYAIRQASSDL